MNYAHTINDLEQFFSISQMLEILA